MMKSLAALIALLSFATAEAVAQEKWHAVESEHFTLFTDAGPERGREFAAQLERFRRMIRLGIKNAALDPPKPIWVYVFKREDGMAEILPELWDDERKWRPAGVFRQGKDRHFIALRLDGGERGLDTIYHEYLHVITALNLGPLPAWLNEGLAEFWETAELRDTVARVGVPSERHLDLLKGYSPLPIVELLSFDYDSSFFDEERRSSIFYAQSWALVHYLMVDETGQGLAKLNDYIRVVSDGADATEAAARCFGDLKELEEALRHYVRRYQFRGFVAKDSPEPAQTSVSARLLETAEVSALKAHFLLLGSGLETAREHLERSLEADADLALAHEGMGLYYYRHNDRKRALGAFERATALDRTAHLSFYYQGLLRRGTPNGFESSFEALTRSVEARSSFAPSQLLLARLTAEYGRNLREGADAARRAVALTPNDPEVHRVLGFVLRAAGSYGEAADAFRAASTRERDERQAGLDWWLMATAYARADRLEEGVHAYQEAVARVPDDYRIWRELGGMLVKAERRSAAADALAAAADLRPKDAGPQRAAGLELRAAGRLDEAVGRLRRAEQLDPQNASLAVDIGIALAELGRFAEALGSFRKALELSPDVRVPPDLMARALRESGLVEESIPYFRDALQTAADEGRAHYELASALSSLGREAEAEPHFQEAARRGYSP